MGIHFLASCQVYAPLVRKSLYRMGRNLPVNLLFFFFAFGVGLRENVRHQFKFCSECNARTSAL